MTAAIRAHDLGAKTLVIEKADVYGGSTAWSGGVIWVPNNPCMAEIGIRDSAEDALRYMDCIIEGYASIASVSAYVETA